MKSRFGLLLVLAILGTLLVSATTSPAEAAPFGARLTRNPAIIGESIKIYGAVPPATRPVQLLVHRGGRWVGAAASRTGAGGSYAFTVRATASAVQYRVFAPKKKIKRKKAAPRYSNVVRVQGVRPSLSLSFAPAPVANPSADNVAVTGLSTPGVATFRPARPGAVVTLWRLQSGAWSKAATGRQSSAGTYRFQVGTGSSASPQDFKAVSSPGSGGSSASSLVVRPTYLDSTFDDNFDGTTLDTDNWASRTDSPSEGRMCGQSDPSMIGVANGFLTLSAQDTGTTSGCPHGFWKNGIIGTAHATTPYTPVRGVFAARVRFQGAHGAHGAFWMQKTTPNGSEIDVAEYFGDHRSDGGLSNGVYMMTSPTTHVRSGGMIKNSQALLGKGKTPSNSWHVYSVEWTSTGYTFRLDGVPTFVTKQYVSQWPEELVLSLATSDWELPAITRGSTPSMQVDWVRGWETPSQSN